VAAGLGVNLFPADAGILFTGGGVLAVEVKLLPFLADVFVDVSEVFGLSAVDGSAGRVVLGTQHFITMLTNVKMDKIIC
jgi:hypothetical protein